LAEGYKQISYRTALRCVNIVIASIVQKLAETAAQPHCPSGYGIIAVCLQLVCHAEQGMLMSDLRLLIVADDPLVRAGLALLLAQQPGGTVVGQMAGDADVLTGLRLYQPDVVVWDFGWQSPCSVPPTRPEQGGVATALEHLVDIREAGQAVVALLSEATDAGAVWTAGVRGLLLRDVDVATLATALPAVAQELVVLDPALALALLPLRQPPPTAPTEVLTPRELEVLQLLAEGLPNKTIADRLHISEHTVKFHVNAILGKLGAQSRTEAVVRATRLGLLLL
jgi:two-component system nitrate/nitrite response regulator NarL